MDRPVSRRAELRLTTLVEDDERLPADAAGTVELLARWGLHQEPQECIWVVAYARTSAIRTVVEVNRGTFSGADLHYPTLLGAVITSGSERFVLVHNHPDGDPTPSQADIEATQRVMRAADLCGLALEDHLIIDPAGSWYSLREGGTLPVLAEPAEPPPTPTST